MRTGAQALAIAGIVQWVLLLAPAPAAADAPVTAAEEVTLDGLGMGPQTVFGAEGVAEAYFPPPTTGIAPSGSFVRVFFSHSSEIGPGSTMLIAVNGQPLTTVALTAGTAAGGVLETRVPSGVVDDQQPNRLQVRFDLRPPAGSGAALYGRVNVQTLMHYELLGAGAGGFPGLETYPYLLLPAGIANPRLLVMLPPAVDAAGAGTAFRVLADLGRRASSRRVRPVVVTTDQVSRLGGGGEAALLVGRIDAMPAAGPILDAAGWHRSASGWVAPNGRVLQKDEGLVLAQVSPWDRRSPLLLLTGSTQVGVDRAASALIADSPLAGPYAMVAQASAGDVGASRGVRLQLLSPRDLAPLGSGTYRLTASFVAPAADPEDVGSLDLAVPALGSSVPSGSVEADVNGTRVAAAALQRGGTQPTHLSATLPGRLLRPGRNALSVDFTIDPPAAGRAAAVAPAPDATLTVAGDDTAAVTLLLPGPPPAGNDLRLLPSPFFDGPGQLQVVLADGTATTLSAAAQAMVGLGARAAGSPPDLGAAFASVWRGPTGDGGLVVIGQPAAGGALDPIGSQLPVGFGGSGDVTTSGQQGAGTIRLRSSLGAVEEVRSSVDGRPVLWIAGTDETMLDAAALTLYSPRLGGAATVVDSAGRLSVRGGSAAGPGGGAPGPSTAALAALLAAVLLVGVLSLQFLRPKGAA